MAAVVFMVAPLAGRRGFVSGDGHRPALEP
jgi:hypothetical protein